MSVGTDILDAQIAQRRDEHLQAMYDAGFLGVCLSGAVCGVGREFFVRAGDVDSVVALLNQRWNLHLQGREENLPAGVALVGGFATGKSVSAEEIKRFPRLSRRCGLTIARGAVNDAEVAR